MQKQVKVLPHPATLYAEGMKQVFNKAREIAKSKGRPLTTQEHFMLYHCQICGENDFEINTVFWAAVDKFRQAKSNDAEVTDKANELISKFSAYFPNVEDAFFYGFEHGKAYTVGCWINEKTTVRCRQHP